MVTGNVFDAVANGKTVLVTLPGSTELWRACDAFREEPHPSLMLVNDLPANQPTKFAFRIVHEGEFTVYEGENEDD